MDARVGARLLTGDLVDSALDTLEAGRGVDSDGDGLEGAKERVSEELRVGVKFCAAVDELS